MAVDPKHSNFNEAERANKTFMMISNWKINNFDLYDLYTNISELWGAKSVPAVKI